MATLTTCENGVAIRGHFSPRGAEEPILAACPYSYHHSLFVIVKASLFLMENETMDTNYTETLTQGRTCHICHYPPWTTLTLEESINCISGDRYNDVQFSSASCPGCMLFVKVFDFATTDPDLRKCYQLWFHATNGEFMISVYSYHSQIRLEVFVLPSAIGLPNLRTASIIPPRTNLDLNITNIKKWLYNCQNTHTRCGE